MFADIFLMFVMAVFVKFMVSSPNDSKRDDALQSILIYGFAVLFLIISFLNKLLS